MSAAQHTPGAVSIFDLPLGSIFQYEQHAGPGAPCFVLLDRGAGGLCAQAPHTCKSAVMQGIYAIAESDAQLRSMRFVQCFNAHDELVRDMRDALALSRAGKHAEAQMTLHAAIAKATRSAS